MKRSKQWDRWESLQFGRWYSARELAVELCVTEATVLRWTRLHSIERRYGWRTIIDTKGRQCYRKIVEFRRIEEDDSERERDA